MHDGYAVATQFEAFGAEGTDVAVALQIVAYYLLENAETLAMEYAQFLLAEELGVVEEMLEVLEGFVGTLAAKVEGWVEGFAFLVDVVVDGLEARILTACLVDGDVFLLGDDETAEGDGHADTVALDHGFLAFDFHHLGKSFLPVDAHYAARGDGGIDNVVVLGGGALGVGGVGRGGLAVCLGVGFVVAFLVEGYALGFGFHLLAGFDGGLAFGLRLFDGVDGVLHGAVGVGYNLLRLFAGGTEYLVFFVLQLLVETLVFVGDFGEETVGHVEFGLAARNLLFVEFHLLQLVLEIEHLSAHLALGVFEHLGWEADVAGYLEGKGTAGMADGKAVEGFHLLGVEEHGTVADAGAGIGHKFEVGEVSGHHTEGAAAVQLFEQGLGDGTSRAGFSAATQLVEQEEGVGVGSLQKLFHVLEGGGIGAEIVVDGLLVADVDENGVEDAKF